MPPLGLSNKAVTDRKSLCSISDVALLFTTGLANSAASFQLGHSKRRPFEGELAAFTLWPEIEKVFGHGYEVRDVESCRF